MTGFAIRCTFVRMITHAALYAKFIFGGKELAGDGTPEGLPLNCRFSCPLVSTPALRFLNCLAIHGKSCRCKSTPKHTATQPAGQLAPPSRWRTLILVTLHPSAHAQDLGSCAIFPKLNWQFTSVMKNCEGGIILDYRLLQKLYRPDPVRFFIQIILRVVLQAWSGSGNFVPHCK